MKMTTFQKIAARVTILAIAALLFTLPFTSAAAEVKTAPTITATVTTAAVAPAAGEEESISEESTVAGAIADFFRDESAGILSGATLLLTLILSLGLRKKIIPSLLDALSTLIGKSREAVGAITAGHEAEHAELMALFERADSMLAEARAATTAAEEAAAALTADGKERTALGEILSEQSDLLYEILMSANLPQYQKDRIGAQHARVKAALSGESHD